MRHFWPVVYNAIEVHGVIFVVDGADKRDEQIELARKCLHTLMHEDGLRRAVFIVIVNDKDRPDKETREEDSQVERWKKYDRKEDFLKYRLGLGDDLHHSCRWRVKHFVINCDSIDGEYDNETDWPKVLDFAKDTLRNDKSFGLSL